MKYDVTYKCGHSGTVKLFGDNKSREWKLNAIANNLCPECAAKRNADILANFNAENNLPVLTGSEKQVAWANSIRKKFVDAAIEKKATALFFNWVRTKTESRFWIDNRNHPSVSSLLNAYRTEIVSLINQ